MANITIRRSIYSHDRTRATKIRAVGMERTVRVQSSRFRCKRSVRTKSFGRHGSQKSNAVQWRFGPSVAKHHNIGAS